MTRPRFTSDELNQRVLQVIQDARPTIDKRITKEELSIRVFGYYTKDETDRKIRDSVSELCIAGHPICSSPEMAGYYIARNFDEAAPCFADLRSRSEVYNQKIDGIKRGLLKQPKPEMREAVQGALWG